MNSDAFPTFRRFFRFVWRCFRRVRRIFLSRRSAVVYLCLVTLGWFALTLDRWHGRRAWAAEKERLAAAGETLDLRELLPKRPPDEENFFAIPELATVRTPDAIPPGADNPLHMWFARNYTMATDKRGKTFRKSLPPLGDFLTLPLNDVCAYFRKTGMLPALPLEPDPAKELLHSGRRWQSTLDALYKAGDRSCAVILPSPFERLDANGILVEPNPGSEARHGLLGILKALLLHSRAAIETGETIIALQDLTVIKKLTEAVKDDRSLLAFVFTQHYLRMEMQLIRLGIKFHRWDEDQLTAFAAGAATLDITKLFCDSLALERAATLARLNSSRDFDMMLLNLDPSKTWLRTLFHRFAPEGPFLRYRVRLSENCSQRIAALKSRTSGEPWLPVLKRLHDEGLPELRGPNIQEGAIQLLSRSLAGQSLLQTALFLERHYLDLQRYPAALAELSLPREMLQDLDGQPLRYQPAPDGRTFRLWSVGWTGLDDSANPKKSDDVVFSTE
jgi:hypothetical protein